MFELQTKFKIREVLDAGGIFTTASYDKYLGWGAL